MGMLVPSLDRESTNSLIVKLDTTNMPHSDISATTAAFAMLRKPEINRCGFARPALDLTCLPFTLCDNNYYKYGVQIWEVVRAF